MEYGYSYMEKMGFAASRWTEVWRTTWTTLVVLLPLRTQPPTVCKERTHGTLCWHAKYAESWRWPQPQPRLDLDTGRELRNDKAKFYRHRWCTCDMGSAERLDNCIQWKQKVDALRAYMAPPGYQTSPMVPLGDQPWNPTTVYGKQNKIWLVVWNMNFIFPFSWE